MELVHNRSYKTREEAKRDIFEYIKIFYKKQRRNYRLGSIKLLNFELKSVALLYIEYIKGNPEINIKMVYKQIMIFLKSEFFRFLLVGGLNTLFGYSLFAFFIFINFHYSLAVLFATILGVLFNFKTIGVIVFKTIDNKLIFKFVLVYIFIYFLNVSGIYIFDLFGLTNKYMVGALLLMPLAIISFVLNRKFVFKR